MPHPKGTVFKTLADRFEEKVERLPDGGCWLWTGFVDKAGYARIRQGGRGSPILYAHRYSYEQSIGPIPPGLTIDHVRERGCEHSHCVNPTHLEAVTLAENSRRAAEPTTHCGNGHERTPENTQRDAVGRIAYCKLCRREARRCPGKGVAAAGR